MTKKDKSEYPSNLFIQARKMASALRPRSKFSNKNARATYNEDDGSWHFKTENKKEKKRRRIRQLTDKQQKGKPLTPEQQEELDAFLGKTDDPEQSERKKLINLAKATFRSRVLKCREDPNEFMEYCFQDSETGKYIEQQWFHREFQDKMSDPSIKDLVTLIARDHGKSTQVEGFAIWSLGNNPNLRIKIVCESDSKAVERLFTIIQHLRINDRVKTVFPWLKPAKLGDWTKHKIVVDRSIIMRDASVEAIGVLSTATGGRCDLMLADDPVGRRNALEQPKMRQTVKSAWDSDWSNLMEPTAKTIYINTPWHRDDLTHKLLRNDTYHVLRYPVEEENGVIKTIWPDKWSVENLAKRKKKIGSLEFDRGFKLIALSGEYATVRGEWIKYWDSQPDLGRLQIYIAFDESSGEGKDYFACTVLGFDEEKLVIYVLDAWHAKYTFLKRAEAVERESKRWQAFKTGVEQSNLKSLEQYLEETTILNVIPLKAVVSKRLRLLGVQPLMERGQVIFNPALHPDRIVDKEATGDLVTQLLDFPLAANDDLVDSYVHALTMIQHFSGMDEEEENEVETNVNVISATPAYRPQERSIMDALFDLRSNRPLKPTSRN